MTDDGLQESDYRKLVDERARERTRAESRSIVKAAVLRVGGLAVGGYAFGEIATKGPIGTVVSTMIGAGLGIAWSWIEANKDAHFALWHAAQTEIRELKATISALEQAAREARPAPVQPTVEERVIARLKALRCPGPKCWNGAEFLLAARDTIGRNIGTQMKLGLLAELSWSDKRDPVLKSFQDFLLELDKLEVLTWPKHGVDSPFTLGALGQRVWLVVQDEAQRAHDREQRLSELRAESAPLPPQ